MSGDSPELEALFDSIAAQHDPVVSRRGGAQGDTPELEALFDSIASAVSRELAAGHEGATACPERVYAQIGRITRQLHNLLRELGPDGLLQKAAREIPDNRDRLHYIASMTAQAAERTLSAAESAQPIQQELGDTARSLAAQWTLLFERKLGVEEFKTLVHDTHAFLARVPSQTEATRAHLMEIVMAQDFQDLTGQVIRKVLEAVQDLEKRLLCLLIETSPEDKRQAVRPALLEGPVIDAEGRDDVVTDQAQVDALLESLGF
ncbi:MAG: protein phosphatase CheZ [Thiobacillaceae bacterium]|nr:protein phosphatase CheZ [Thiobacillaceae bacterium]MCX7672562.1 protein phosphatase CheZ [Thiobacillaceae bacterium]MDW8322502.1 protein phosphatase CheZ [Burkholderiales bacterium]